MRVRALAAYLDIGVNAAYDLVASERISSVRIGRSIRITRNALLEFLENGDVAPKDDATPVTTPNLQERSGHAEG